MNEQNFNCYKNNYYPNEYNNYSNDKDIEFKKDKCCIKKVEESFCCFPSYYNEEREDKFDKKEKCFEGSFRICPKSCDYNQNTRNSEYCNHNDRNNCYEDYKKNCHENNSKMNYRPCCFCRLFRW